MNEARFWQIISDSRSDFDPELKDGNLDRQAERLREILRELAPAQIVEFAWHFDTKFVNAYRWDLWAVLRLVEGGGSDDWFMDFRYWLISMDARSTRRRSPTRTALSMWLIPRDSRLPRSRSLEPSRIRSTRN